jgi:hypothetical protein
MNPAAWSRKLPQDWYPGAIPSNVSVCETAYLGTSYSFHEYRSVPVLAFASAVVLRLIRRFWTLAPTARSAWASLLS